MRDNIGHKVLGSPAYSVLTAGAKKSVLACFEKIKLVHYTETDEIFLARIMKIKDVLLSKYSILSYLFDIRACNMQALVVTHAFRVAKTPVLVVFKL